MRLKISIVATALSFLMVLFVGPIQAQQSVNPIAVILLSRGITPTFVDPPTIGATGEIPTTTVFSGKKWLQVAFEFTAQNAEKGFIDEIKFKIYIEAKEYRDLNDRVGVPVVLTGETTFVNVPASSSPGGTKNTGYFFVHPASIDRYGGPDRGFKFLGTKKTSNSGGAGNYDIRIVATIGGQPVMLDKDGVVPYVDLLKDDPAWVDTCKVVPNQVLGKDQSPWCLTWLDSTPMIKPRNSGTTE